jgi:hypothetical protein
VTGSNRRPLLVRQVALEVYAKVMQLHAQRDTGERLDALIRAGLERIAPGYS